MNQTINILAFAIFAILWVAFALAIIGRPRTVHDAWASFRGLALPAQILLGLLLLPVVLGLLIWETRWTLWLRLALVIALAWVNLYTFFPRF